MSLIMFSGSAFLLFFANYWRDTKHYSFHLFVFVMTGVLLKLYITQWFIKVNNADNEGMFQEVWTCNECKCRMKVQLNAFET